MTTYRKILTFFTSFLLGSLLLAEEPQILDAVFIEAAPEDESILPTIRPVESVLMQPGNVLSTPRGVSTITKGQLERQNIQRIEELSPFITGAYSAPIFGNAGVPTIRGDLGEAYQNGQRKTFNRNVFPVSFNGVEAIDAVRGAPPAVFGFGNATGGYINLVTKRPFFDSWRTQIRGTVGKWDYYRGQIDTSGPINERLAVRISVDVLDSDSFYRLVSNDSVSVFGALTFRPSETLEIDVNAEYFTASYTEVLGTTRPTQDLIDRGIYITGSSVGEPGVPLFGNTFEPTGTVRIDGSQILLAPGDGANADVITAQAIVRKTLANDSTLVNRTYFEDVTAERFSSYFFNGYLPESYTFENRTEWNWEGELFGLNHNILAGVALRYEFRKSFVDILNQVFNPFDVTADPDTLRFPADQLFFVQPVPGTNFLAVPGGRYPREGMGPSVGLSATLRSELYNTGFFLQDRIELTERLSLLLGGRADFVWVDSEDPLPRAGNEAASDSYSTSLWSGSASLVWEPIDNLFTYVTLNRAAAVEGSGSSGGFGLNSNLGTGELNFIAPELFENSSELIELGAKYSFLQDTAFVGATLYHQERNRLNPRFNLPDEIRVRGVELEAIFQPNRNLSVGTNFSYSEANYKNGPLPGSIQTVPFFDPSQPSGNFGAYEQGDYRVPGLPRTLWNTFVNYNLESGFGAGAVLQTQGSQNLDLFGNVVIPSQHTLNLSAFYLGESLDVIVNVFNATDEFNWRPSATPFAGADLVTRELPRHWQITVRYRF